MSRCLVIINPVSGGGAARRYALDLQWKLSTLFDTMQPVLQRPLARMVSMPFSVWVAMVPLMKR